MKSEISKKEAVLAEERLKRRDVEKRLREMEEENLKLREYLDLIMLTKLRN
jgi:hypothetical protein